MNRRKIETWNIAQLASHSTMTAKYGCTHSSAPYDRKYIELIKYQLDLKWDNEINEISSLNWTCRALTFVHNLRRNSSKPMLSSKVTILVTMVKKIFHKLLKIWLKETFCQNNNMKQIKNWFLCWRSHQKDSSVRWIFHKLFLLWGRNAKQWIVLLPCVGTKL